MIFFVWGGCFESRYWVPAHSHFCATLACICPSGLFVCKCTPKCNMLTLPNRAEITPINWELIPVMYWVSLLPTFWWTCVRHVSGTHNSWQSAKLLYSCSDLLKGGYCLNPLFQCSLGGMNRPHTFMALSSWGYSWGSRTSISSLLRLLPKWLGKFAGPRS